MSTAELARLIGKKAVYTFAPNFKRPEVVLEIPVKIKNARHSFGRVDVLVVPVRGEGAAWVQMDSVRICK